MTNTTGPDELRRMADSIPDTRNEAQRASAFVAMADAWEADRRELSNVNADREKIWKALQDNEAALERARALVPDELRECVTKPGRGYAECGCKDSAEGDKHCMYCLWPEWTHALAAALKVDNPNG